MKNKYSYTNENKEVEILNPNSLELVLSGIVGAIITYCVFPIIFKQGRTLGKKVFKLALANCSEPSSPNLSSITLSKYGESMHLHPNGTEGYFFSAEDVYEALKKDPKFSKPDQWRIDMYQLKNLFYYFV